jgi:uncharacterized protein (TIGR02145 family)
MSYEWQRSVNGTTWEHHQQSSGGQYTPDNAQTKPFHFFDMADPEMKLIDTMYFRLVANCTTGCAPAYSNVAKVYPRPLPVFAGWNLQSNNQPVSQNEQEEVVTHLKYLADLCGNDTYANYERQDIVDFTYGGYYQWGRKDDYGYAVQNSNAKCENLVGVTFDGIGLPNGTSGSWFVANNGIDWSSSPLHTLWGNGFEISQPTTGGGWPGSVTSSQYSLYQKPVKGPGDPCPAGWRVPTQDDWECLLDYCDPGDALTGDVYNLNTSSGVAHTTTGYTWMAYRWCVHNSFGAGPCDLIATWTFKNTTQDWSEFSPGGYIVYKTADYNKALGLGWNPNNGFSPSSAIDLFIYHLGYPDEWRLIPVVVLPAAGYRVAGNSNPCGFMQGQGEVGCYWSSSRSGIYSYILSFNSSSVSFNIAPRANGCAVRCVRMEP